MSTQNDRRDSAWLASAVRTLAGDVHRLAAHGGCDPDELAALAGRIRSVREVLPGRPTPLHRWLDGLEHQVEGLPGGTTTLV